MSGTAYFESRVLPDGTHEVAIIGAGGERMVMRRGEKQEVEAFREGFAACLGVMDGMLALMKPGTAWHP